MNIIKNVALRMLLLSLVLCSPYVYSGYFRTIEDVDIFEAVQRGYEERVLQLVNANQSEDARKTFVNQQNGQRETLLHIAVEAGQSGVVDILINAGTNVNLQDMMGLTPLHVAVAYLRYDLILKLIAAGASLDIKDHNNRTPLLIAQRDAHAPIDLDRQAMVMLLEKYEKLIDAARQRDKLGYDKEKYEIVSTAMLDQSEKNNSPLGILPGDLTIMKEIAYWGRQSEEDKIRQQAAQELQEWLEKERRLAQIALDNWLKKPLQLLIHSK